MSDESQKDFDPALAAEYYGVIRNDLKNMTAGQYQVYQQAAADHAKENADTTEKDFNRKLATMSGAEFQKLTTEIAFDTQPRHFAEKK